MKDFIAVFDSGIGGLTVYNTLKEKFPMENIVYLADTLNCPYGTKSLEEINKISINNILYLKNLGAKLIIIACNTATSSVIKEIKDSEGYIVGVIEPTANLAYNLSKTKKIGLFATNLTVNTKAYDKYLKDAKISSVGCSDFVLPIENGDIHSDNMKKLIENHVNDLDDIDTLILGCTHFPYIKDEISKFLPNVKLVESGEATFNVSYEYLKDHRLLSNIKNRELRFLTTGNLDSVKIQLKRLNQKFDLVEEIKVN